MTLRMSELFEDHIKSVISHFKSEKKRSDNREGSNKKKNARPTRNNGAGPSTSQDHHNSGDSDDDDDDGRPNGKVNGRSRRAQAQSNGVSSSSNTRDSQAGPSKKSRNPRHKSSAEEDTNGSESSSDDSSNSEESSGIPLSELGRNKPLKKLHRKKKSQQKRGAVSSSSPKKNSRNPKRRKIKDELLSEPEPEAENSENESHASKSARSTPELTMSRRSNRQTVKRRIQSSSDEVGENNKQMRGDEKQKRICKRPKRYESDQSFHVEGSKNKPADSDSDKPRATRESKKKNFHEWALTSDDDDDDDEDFNQKPQTSSQAQKSAARRALARKKPNVSGSDQSDGKKTKPGPSRRSARVQKTSQSQEDESEESDEQNKPSTSTNVSSNSRLSNGVAQAQTSQQSRTTRSQNQPTTARGTINDHNYGEPGPSSTASVAPRETRSAILSRHQRNADELDRSTLEDGSLASSTQNPRLLRLRSSNVTAPTGNFELLNGIRRTTRNRVRHNYFEDENENDNEDTTRAMQPLHQSSSRLRIKREPIRDDPSDDSDSYSEEDKTPLKLMASSSKKNHEHNTRNGTAVNRVKRNIDMDEEQVC